MQSLPQPLEFEWDQGNIDKNLIKHHVANQEAEQVFLNTPNLILPDPKHSQTETRLNILGRTDNHKLISIVFTIRNNLIRVISARPMSRRQRSFYETQTHS